MKIRTSLSGAAGAVAVLLLSGCSAGGPTVESACVELRGAFDSAMGSMEAATSSGTAEAASVHLDSIEEKLEAMGEVVAPNDEWAGERDALLKEGLAVHRGLERLLGGSGEEAAELAEARFLDAALDMADTCGWE